MDITVRDVQNYSRQSSPHAIQPRGCDIGEVVIHWNKLNAFCQLDHLYLEGDFNVRRFSPVVWSWITAMYSNICLLVKVYSYNSESLCIASTIREYWPRSSLVYVVTLYPLRGNWMCGETSVLAKVRRVHIGTPWPHHLKSVGHLGIGNNLHYLKGTGNS